MLRFYNRLDEAKKGEVSDNIFVFDLPNRVRVVKLFPAVSLVLALNGIISTSNIFKSEELIYPLFLVENTDPFSSYKNYEGTTM